MKKRFAIALITVLFACNSAEELPQDILPDSTMKSIVVELSIVDAAYNIALSSPNAPKFKPELFYEQVMLQHKTTRQQFNRSLSYYAIHTSRFQKVYEEALIDLSRRQAEANK